ncbi:MAG: NAD+ synthase [Chloroflexi bacterium]|nr:NAD+ synthase [Chloroflexota bacterium]
MRSLRLAMAQINTTVGDLTDNADKILRYIDEARSLDADLVTFPEMAITGYPPEDLLLKPQFIQDNRKALQRVVEGCSGITAVVGFIDSGQDIYNAAAIIHDGEVAGVHHKNYLPNYGVFDENRYFQAGTDAPIFTINGIGVGVNICEDIWYATGPIISQAYGDAEVIININASPYHTGKGKFRERMLATRASDNAVIVSYTNLVGGQDELVFDGQSMIVDERGEVVARGKQFQEDLIVADLDVEAVFRTRLHDPRRRKEKLAFQQAQGAPKRIFVSPWVERRRKPLPPRCVEPLPPDAEVYEALVLGTHDYVRKTGFQKVVLGLSGGIDSSLTAVIAVDALGPENVLCVTMPSKFSSRGSIEDSEALAKNVGVKLLNIPIRDTYDAYLVALAEPFRGTEFGIAEENLQARIRGNLLMGLSNKFGWLVLTTGNKSETATGYSTLYGDMAGGFAVIKDVPKTLIYELARYRNRKAEWDIIPQSVIEKEPSAELKPDQRDIDTLPPYEKLDPVIHAYVVEDRSFEEMVAMGFDEAIVKKVITMVDRNEYKRRQAPPGIKITPRAFGRDRRLPIVNHYKSF